MGMALETLTQIREVQTTSAPQNSRQVVVIHVYMHTCTGDLMEAFGFIYCLLSA